MAEEHIPWGTGTHEIAVFLEVAGCVARYNAPMGRLPNIGRIADEYAAMAEISKRAFDSSLKALTPRAVYS